MYLYTMARKFGNLESATENILDQRLSCQNKVTSSNLSMSSRFSYTKSSGSGLSDYSPQELAAIIKRYQTELERLNIENEIYEKYLDKVLPNSLLGMAQYLDSTTQLAHRVQTLEKSLAGSNISNVMSASSTVLLGSAARSQSKVISDRILTSQMNFRGSTMKSMGSTGSSSNNTIKLTYVIRSEMVMNAVDDMKFALELFIDECITSKFKRKAEIEEKKIALGEIKTARANLDQSMNAVGTEMFTTPSERFLRYMNDLLKHYDHKLGKVRLKLSTARTHMKNVKTQLVQKLELGELVKPTDFEELRIENKDYATNLEAKNLYILELKRAAGICFSKLTAKRRFLFDSMDRVKKLAAETEAKISLAKKLAEEEVKTKKEVLNAEHEFADMKSLVTNYPPISTMDYIKKKADLKEIERNIHIWQRRMNLQAETINILRNKLRAITPHKYATKKKFPEKGDSRRATFVGLNEESVKRFLSFSADSKRSFASFGSKNSTNSNPELEL